MTSFLETVEAIQKDTVTPEGKKKAVTFNKAKFEELTTSLFNTPDYEVQEAVKDETAEKGFKIVTTQPVKEFRKSLEQLLIDAGVDKVEAAHVAQTAQLKNLNGVYEIISEAIYQYIKAGKKFSFITKEDYTGELVMDTVDEFVDERNNPAKPGETVKNRYEKHTKLKAKSTVPSWLKHRI